MPFKLSGLSLFLVVPSQPRARTALASNPQPPTSPPFFLFLPQPTSAPKVLWYPYKHLHPVPLPEMLCTAHHSPINLPPVLDTMSTRRDAVLCRVVLATQVNACNSSCWHTSEGSKSRAIV